MWRDPGGAGGRSVGWWIGSNSHTSEVLKGLKTKKEKRQITGRLAKGKDMLGLEAFDERISFVLLSQVVLLPFLQIKISGLNLDKMLDRGHLVSKR